MDKSKFELIWEPNRGPGLICVVTEPLPEGGFTLCTWMSNRQSTSLATLNTLALQHWVDKHANQT